MGIVYLAEDTTLGREVALKCVQGALAEDDSLLRRFEAEARSVGKLFHPHIVPINALSREEGVLYIEMPYLSGGSLDSVLESRGPHCPEVVLYCTEILDALAACHEQGLVHRDVKPSNVLLDAQGRALLCDFGLAKVIGEEIGSSRTNLSATSFFVGTPHYAPLEAWDGGRPTPAWDLYSIGVILFEGLSGQPLHETHSLLGHMRALERDPVPVLSEIRQDISPELSALVAALLKTDPGDRLSDARVARNDLMHTPEYARLEASADDVMTLVQRPPRLYIRRLRSKASTLRNRRSAVGFALGCVLVALIYFVGRPPGIRGGREAPLPQASVWALPEYTAEKLLATARFGPDKGPQVLAEVHASAGDSPGERWLVLRAQDGVTRSVLAVADERIALLTLSPESEQHFSVSGFWGQYVDGFMLEAASGAVAGEGRWIDASGGLYADISYTAERQGMAWDDKLLLQPVEDTDTRFLWELESRPLLLRLLGDELYHRDAIWRNMAPAWLPALESNYVLAHTLGEGQVIVVDGYFEDWPEHSATAGVVPGWPASIRPTVAVAEDERGLYFAFAVAAPLQDATVEVRLRRTAPEMAGPTADVHLSFTKAEERGARESGGDSAVTWQFVQLTKDDNWRGELFVPFSEAGSGDLTDPLFFRANIRVFQRRTGSAREREVRWGAPDLVDLDHGLLIQIPGSYGSETTP